MPDTSHMVRAADAKVVLISLDRHGEEAARRAAATLADGDVSIRLDHFAAVEFSKPGPAQDATLAAIADADVLIVTMLFMEDHIHAVLPALRERAAACQAIVGLLASGEIIQLTHLGRLDMGKKARGPLALLKRLRGAKSTGAAGQRSTGATAAHGTKASGPSARTSSGAGQMKMLRRLPKLLKFIPGTAQDLRSYFLCMHYYLSGSDTNLVNMTRMLVKRYCTNIDQTMRTAMRVDPPVDYPDVGLYHPAIPDRITTDIAALPRVDTVSGQQDKTVQQGGTARGRIGILLMRAYILSRDTGHYDAVIAALEARGFDVVPAFASALDMREGIKAFMMDKDGRASVDAVLSLTGFSLVGGPAYNDADAAIQMLSDLNVPYVAAQSLEFQTASAWADNPQGLSPVETTMMVAIPELEGATIPSVVAGRSITGSMDGLPDQIRRLADRLAKLVAMRRTPIADRRLAITLFNFPPNGGAAGTAAFLSVYKSLHATLSRLQAEGYTVDVPETADALKASLFSSDPLCPEALRVHHRIDGNSYIRREPNLGELEAVWGPAPGLADTDGQNILIHGRQFGNILVSFQPSLGIEGDPMRLMFGQGHAPTHAMSAYYRYLQDDYGAHALLHFGTHGGLEFMPGKQVGLSQKCWPERLIGDLPHFYLYAANNPSEGTIAKRRSGAVLISYLTPGVSEAGLYAKLEALSDLLDAWFAMPQKVQESPEGEALDHAIRDAANAADMDTGTGSAGLNALASDLQELKETLIPSGLHVLGEAMDQDMLEDTLSAVAKVAQHGLVPDPQNGDTPPSYADDVNAGSSRVTAGSQAPRLSRAVIADIAAGRSPIVDAAYAPLVHHLQAFRAAVTTNPELDALINALNGGYTPPAPGGDLISNADILPTGRNIHAFDPFRLPTPSAVVEGEAAAKLLIDRLKADLGAYPTTIAMVLWGTDTLKSGGMPVAQVMALMGAKVRTDSYGRIVGAALIPLAELGRPRIDVTVTISGIFRDLLPNQSRMLAEAAWLAAHADEPADMNPIRGHVLDAVKAHGLTEDQAALRIFANDNGAYGSNVNMLIDNSMWDDDRDLADCFSARKGYAIDHEGTVGHAPASLNCLLGHIEATYQNLDSLEMGVTTIDHYFDTLGGLSKAVELAQDKDSLPVLIGDHASGASTVRSLQDQVALETRTRMLNPRWYTPLLEHGAEGVRHIEAAVTNTMGWSATTGSVDPWVYRSITETYVLDEDLRTRMAELNPAASAKMVNRLMEASDRAYWQPDPDMLSALEAAGEECEDRLEGLYAGTTAYAGEDRD